jgi:hypothetical protein
LPFNLRRYAADAQAGKLLTDTQTALLQWANEVGLCRLNQVDP